MLVSRLTLLGLVLIATAIPEVAEGARRIRRNPRNTADMFKDYVDLYMGLALPFTHDGTAMVHGLSGWYQPYEHLGLGTGFSWVLNEDRVAAPGGFVFSISSGTGTVMKVRKGFGAALNVVGSAGLNPFKPGSASRQTAYAIGRANSADWLAFMPDHAVLSLTAVGSVWLSQTMFNVSCGPRFALPLDEGTGEGNLTAVSYSGSFDFGWGDWRGAYGIGFGIAGLKETTREKEHLLGLSAKLGLWIGAIDLSPFIGIWAPLLGEDAGIKVSLFFGAQWSFDARIKKDQRDLLPPSPTTAMVPWPR